MSSKLNVKQPKREGRPRSSDKLRKGKRDGTPDKPTTPITSQDALMEEGTPQLDRAVIINDEILSLQIKPEDLQKLREPQPPTGGRPSPPRASVVVRKMKPASEWDRPAPRLVTVARPAPPDAPLKEVDYTGAAGPRFDLEGGMIEHSILGSIEDYKKEAERCGELPTALTQIRDEDRKPRVLSAKYERSQVSKHPSYQSVDESNALKNWQAKMTERKRQQGHLSKLLNKPVEQLVMNQADNYRQTQELRYLIDRTIPTMDYGKGYRIGSEFWKQQERIGNDLTGTHMTLTQTERGYPPPVQHVGVPRTVLEEKGTHFSAPSTQFHKPWHKSAYLRQRVNQLHPVMKELDPHIPDLLGMELVGQSVDAEREKQQQDDLRALQEEAELEYEEGGVEPEDLDPLRAHPDVRPEPVFGPSIQFAGKTARWTGDGRSLEGQLGCEARIAMEAYAGQRTTAYLEVVNDGTTSIYYDWKKVTKTNPFEMITAKVQRFYFNNSSGVILPGDNVRFPFVYKSPNAGVFTEQWHFQTHPVVCGGAALVVTLRGTALQEDKYKKQRSELEQELALKQAEQVVRGVLDDLLSGVRTPPRPSSPIDAYITEEEVFNRRNPALHYHNETVADLRTLYAELFPEEERESVEWNLNVNCVRQLLMQTELEENQRDELLARLNKALVQLSFPPFTPAQRQMHAAGYKLMCEASEKMVGHATQLRTVLGLPEKDDEALPEEPSPVPRASSGRVRSGPNSAKSTRAGSAASESSSSAGSTRTTPKPGESRRAGGSRGGQKPDPKDAKKKDKEPKGGAKTPAKETPKPGGKITPGPGTQAKRPTTRGTDPTPGADRITTPTPAGVEPLVHTKYREKVYTQTYMVLSDMLDEMAAVFADVESKEGSKPLLL